MDMFINDLSIFSCDVLVQISFAYFLLGCLSCWFARILYIFSLPAVRFICGKFFPPRYCLTFFLAVVS